MYIIHWIILEHKIIKKNKKYISIYNLFIFNQNYLFIERLSELFLDQLLKVAYLLVKG